MLIIVINDESGCDDNKLNYQFIIIFPSMWALTITINSLDSELKLKER